MGLDITAISNATRVDKCRAEDCSLFHERVTVINSHARAADGLHDGACYIGTGTTLEFRAGSYSGYNRWREWLSVMALDVTPEAIWKNRGHYEGKPFVELIDFSDCDGTIGPNTSAKLHKDFVEHLDKARESSTVDGWYFDLYEKWMAAFKIASNGGFVSFH